MGPLGIICVVFFSALAVFAAIGLILKFRSKGKENEKKERSSEQTVENAADLLDRFNRARYQNKDGK